MKVSWKVSLAAGALAGLWIVGVVLAARPAAQEQPRMRDSIVGKKAGVYFKNVSTSTLKELSVDDFIGAMGVMTDALGLDCADCHPNAGSDQVDWVFDTARKKTARRQASTATTTETSNASRKRSPSGPMLNIDMQTSQGILAAAASFRTSSTYSGRNHPSFTSASSRLFTRFR